MANTTMTWKDKTTDYQERMRNKIRHSSILPKLVRYSEGDETILTHSQALVGLKLISKVIPDLQTMQIEHTVDHAAMNIYELNSRLSSLGYDSASIWQQINGSTTDSVAIEHDPNTTESVVKPVDKSDPNQEIIQTPPPPE